MSIKTLFVFCVQALLIQYSLAQALRGLSNYANFGRKNLETNLIGTSNNAGNTIISSNGNCNSGNTVIVPNGNCNSGNAVIVPNGNCLANAEVLVPSSVFSSGIITEVVPNLQFGDVTLTGDLPIGGSIKVCGCFPVYGSVNVEGCVPSTGSAVVNTQGLGCGCTK